MEEHFEIATPLGEVWMWGRDTGAPLCVVVTGAFAGFAVFDGLQLALSNFDVLRTHLPGNHSPPLADARIEVMGAALAQAMDARFAGRPFVMIGLSTGALVVMAAHSPGLRALLLVEPFLRTRHVWPFADMLEPHPEPQQREILWRILGVREGETAERDYRPLLAGLQVPALVLLGSDPLQPKRTTARLPSLVDDADRALFVAHPNVRVVEVSGTGHDLVAQNNLAFLDAVTRLCRVVVPDTLAGGPPAS